MALRISPIFVSVLGLLAFFVAYRSLPFDLRCSSRWVLDPSYIRTSEFSCKTDEILRFDPAPPKSIAQFLTEKVEKGFSEDKEVAGLDFSSKALLSEVVHSVKADREAANFKQEKVFNFDYGVLRVVKRIVVCSSYRTSLREFTVVTLSPEFTIPTSNPDYAGLPPKDPSIHRTCTWLADGDVGAPRFQSVQAMNQTGRSYVGNGVVEFRWMEEIHGTSYDCLLIQCSFPEPVGTDRAGGFLYLNFSHGSQGSELAPVFHEQAKQLEPSAFEANEYLYEFAFCSAPVFTKLTAVHVKQFLMYHHALFDGNVHFFFYDSLGIDDDTMAVLQPLIDAGALTVVDFKKEKEYDTWYHSQVLAINDCLYRTRLLANWTLFWDLDEYLHIVPPFTLRTLLQENKDATWISFGKIDFALTHCSPNTSLDGNSEWAVERMLYREQRPICGEMCNGDRGARKWMGNPRKVEGGRIHFVMYPNDIRAGVVLSTKVARMNHYRGLVAPRGQYSCQEIRDPRFYNSTTSLDGRTLWRDDELATIVSTSLKSSVESLEMFRV